MRLRVPSRVLALALLAASAAACSRPVPEAEAASTPPDTLFDRVVELFREDRMPEAVVLLREQIAREPRDTGSRALLGHLYHHLEMPAEGIRSAREALRIDACSSNAHVVLSILYNPIHSGAGHTDADSSWSHARAAPACDEDDGNAWINVYAQALERGDEVLADRALLRLHELGFFAPSIVAHNRWVLESLPPRAILVTYGDLDTYPAWMLQAALDVRPDVLVVNANFLNLPWYAERLRRMHRVPFETPPHLVTAMEAGLRDDGSVVLPAHRIVEGWRLLRRTGDLQRDLAFAPSIPADLYEHGSGAVRHVGTHRILDPRATADRVDEQAIAAALAGVRASDFAGPGTTPRDRSLVRNAHRTPGGLFPFFAGLDLAREQLDRGRREDARRTITWARAFAAEVGLGPDLLVLVEELDAELGG